MVSLGRNMGSGRMEDVYIVGRDGFYDEMIRMAGGVNVFDGGSIKFPTVSAEGIMRLNPEVIIDMVPDLADAGLSEEQVAMEWQSLAGVDAVKNGRVHVLAQDYVVIPGPRFILILEAMAHAIHPELAWEGR